MTEETEEQKKALKKAKQAAAHRKWRESPKGQEYLRKRREELGWKRRQKEVNEPTA